LPDILTHVYCADFARKNFENTTVMRQIIDRHIPAFYLGSQGPDFLFYFRVWPWKKDMGVPKLADFVHKTKTSEFLGTAIDTLKEVDLASDDGQMILAYWMGFICHYALDSTAHPYIYYHSGINKDETSKLNGDKHNHKYLENIIDTLLIQKYDHVVDLPRSQYACLPNKASALMPVFDHVSMVFEKVYEHPLPPRVIHESVVDMKKLAGLMNDPKHRYRWLFGKAERIISKPKYITTAAHPAKPEVQADFLNLAHNKWVHPCDVTIEYTDSFLDLFDQAMDKSVDLMTYAWDTFKNKHSKDDLMTYFGNFSYDTGLKCGDLRDLRFSDSLFTRHR